MPALTPAFRALRFGPFVLNLRSGELLKGSRKLKLQEQPFKILAMLLERAGKVVTREELQKQLWPDNTFVDFDHGINMGIGKIREALGDSSKKPEFVETVGRRGYRFMVGVEPVVERATPSPHTFRTTSELLLAHRHSVGRQKEHAELRAAFESAAAGQGLFVCVAGEPGIGKTTLVQDFLYALQAGGKTFGLAIGRCSQRLAGEEAYLPFLEAIESLVRSDGDAVAATLRMLAPSWYAQLFPLSGSDPADMRLQEYVTHSTQEKVKRELAAFFREVTLRDPLVLFFDDLHWVDPSTTDLLAYLATKFDSTKILLIGAYRPSDLLLSGNPFIAVKRDLTARGTCRQIDVEFLSPGDVGRYIALEFPENCFPQEFAGLIHSRTEGSPLFMVDLLRYLRDKNVLLKTEGDENWRLAQSLPDLSRDFPQSAKSMIERKIDQLGARDREVLATAAVQGYEFDSAAVARALEADTTEIEEILDRLDGVHAFVKRLSEDELPTAAPTVRYRFVHVLYQNALYTSLTPTRRATQSGALAHALEAFYGVKSSTVASQLGFLYETARDPSRATRYFLLAAQNAQRIFANQEAITLARRGLALLEKVPDSPERTRKELDLQVTLAFSFLCTRGYAAHETGTNMERARELCERLSETTSLVPVLFGLWTYYISKGEMNTARSTAQRLSTISESAQDSAFIIGAKAAMGTSLAQHGDFVAALQQFQDSANVYDINQHARYVQMYRLDPHIHALGILARTLCFLGFPDQALQKAEDSLKLARTLSSPLSLAFCQDLACQVFQFLHQAQKLKEVGEECIALCDEHGVVLERAWTSCFYGWAIAQMGKTEEGISMARSALDDQLSIGAQVARPQSLAVLAETLWQAGRVEEAINAAEDGLCVSARNEEGYYDAELWRLKGEFLKMQGNLPDAEDCFLKAIEIARQQSAKSFELRASTSLARLRQKQGKRQEARQLLGDIYAWFTEGFDTADLQEAASLLQELS